MRLLHIAISLVAVSIGVSLPVGAQQETTRPNVFFDCDGRNCNSQYYRTEITWVNWVNDRQVSDVHVIMASIQTGAGGREYQLDFIGEGNFEGQYQDQLLFQTLPTDTEREELDGIAHTLGLGLARFANVAGYRGIVSLQGPEAGAVTRTERVVSQEEVDDPWNLWVFRINGNGNVDGEETRDTRRLFGSFNASRVSPTWKINLNGNVNYNRREFELEDGTFSDTRTDFGFNPLVVYSIADHWSIGFQGQVARMTNVNQNFRVELSPALEYSFFPYVEATRRALTVFYKIGPSYRDYIEQTIFLETAETRFEQSVEIEFSQRQPWGDAGVTIRGSHFLHDFNRNNLSMRGDVEYRIVRGFSVNARGNIGWVDDQIYLPLDDASDAETLLRLQRRATDFEYCVSVGFSIQFGSIFNNVVNNRFRGVGGFGGFGGGGGGGCRGGGF
jgi:hypothetical protein